MKRIAWLLLVFAVSLYWSAAARSEDGCSDCSCACSCDPVFIQSDQRNASGLAQARAARAKRVKALTTKVKMTVDLREKKG